MPFKIIVNADDLGMSEAVNEAIFRGMANGAITSASMLSNGPAAPGLAKSTTLFPQCSIGVHLNLTEFEPLCPQSHQDLACILDENGRFNGNEIRKIRITLPVLRAVYREWCAQIENLMRWGVKLSHIDSHHHVHTIPQFLPLLAALRWRYRIVRVRISRNLYTDSDRPSRRVLAGKRLYNLSLRRIGFRTTELFTDLETFVSQDAVLPRAWESAELMVHPGADAAREANLLRSDLLRVLEYPCSAITYQQL